MAGIAHFTNFFKWVEAAEADWFRSIGVPMASQTDEIMRGWPRVQASARYKAPVHFGDWVEVTLQVESAEGSRLNFIWTVHNLGQDKQSRTLAARGEMVTCYVERPLAGGKMRSARIPEAWRTGLLGSL